MKSLRQFFHHRIFLVVALLAISGLILIYFATAIPVRIWVDDQWVVVHTHARKVGSVLQNAGIELREGDQVFPNVSSLLNATQAIEIQRGYTVYLNIDGELSQVVTTEKTAADILSSVSINLLPGDRVWIDGVPEKNPERVLAVQPEVISFKGGLEVSLKVDGNEMNIRSTAPTVGDALEESGIAFMEADLVQPPPEAALIGAEEIILRHARSVSVYIDDLGMDTYVVAEHVGEALQIVGLPLIGLDYSIPDENEPIPENGIIRIVRVKEEVIIEQTPVPFETVYEPNPDLEIDNQAVMETGSYGVLANQVRVRYENGEEISRIVEGEWIAREPQPRKVGYGTKIVVRTLDTPDGPIQYWRAIQMWATSYSPSRAGVPEDYQWFGITACGKKLVKGLVAIDNRYIPFYTMMYVPGYGSAEACDIGGGVKGRWIDLGYSDNNYKEWHQYVTVYFLTPVPPANSITWVFP